jgi:hypothetical protein
MTFEDEPDVTGEELDDILEEFPQLSLIRPFVETARKCAWFTGLGTPIGDGVRSKARAYADGLGFPEVELAPLANWEDATDAAVSLDLDTPSWEAEEQLRAGLTMECIDTLGEEAIEVAATYVSSQVTPPITLGARTTADLWSVRDQNLINAAVGAGVQTCHLALLSLLAGQATPDHPFTAKFELFEAGRWPIAITGNSLNLF